MKCSLLSLGGLSVYVRNRSHSLITYVNYAQNSVARNRHKAPYFDPRELIDATEVAALLELTHRNSISVYRKRYPDFPAPIIAKGRCLLWARADIEAWDKRRHRSPQ
jgi:predicted DNA-binding transcriptional regulator AlpA